MKKLLALLLIMTVSFVSANTVETKSGYGNHESYDSSYLLQKNTNRNNLDFETSGLKTHFLPPLPGDCPPNPFNTQTGCTCNGGVIICYLK
jgi:hypothetical protein